MTAPHPHRRRGASAIEFALCMPFVLLLIIGSVDCAMWTLAHQSLARAVQDGARVGAEFLVPDDGNGKEIENAALAATRTAVQQAGFDPSEVALSAVWSVENNRKAWLAVQATATNTPLMGIRSPFAVDVRKRFVVFTQEQPND